MPRHLPRTTSRDHRHGAVQRAAVMPAGRGESGVVAIEFALTLPIILTFLFAVIQFGQLFNHLNDSNQMAANGARFAAVDNNPGGSTLALQDYIAGQGDTQHLRDNAEVRICFPGDGSDVGEPVRVSVSSSFTLIPLLGGATLSVNGHATMRIERPPTKYSESAGCP